MPWTLTPAGMDKCVEEPERRVTPWGDERLVFFFSGLRQGLLSLLPSVHGLPCRLPPKRPRATPAYDLRNRLVADVFQTATLEEHR